MIIRRNTKAYKTIAAIVAACETRADRHKLIRLYITKAGHTIQDRLPVEGIEGDTDVFYDLNFAAVLTHLHSTDHQLQQSDDEPGLYFFHSGSNKVWDENPFEFDEQVVKEFADLPELPVTRKREKPAKVAALPKRAPVPPQKAGSKKHHADDSKTKAHPAGPSSKSKPAEKPVPVERQPRFKLAHPIRFTDIDKIVMREAKLTKEDVLDYYYKMADRILPYLKDRPQLVRLYNDRGMAKEYGDVRALQDEALVELPAWMSTGSAGQHGEVVLCQHKEDLLFLIEQGAVNFFAGHARIKSAAMPDYAVIGLSAAEDAFDKVVEVALAAYTILTGLKLPSGVKTDGVSGLHVYIPLDGKHPYDAAQHLVAGICKLICLKVRDAAALASGDEPTYGKVVIDDEINDAAKTIIAPYALVPDGGIVATPLQWDEVTKGLRTDKFNYENIFKRLKDVGDPFEQLFKKKVNGMDVAKRLEEHYGFL